MATTQEFQVRLRRAVNEAVQKVLAEGDLPAGEDGEALFTIIENLALAAGDAISLEIFEQKLHELECGGEPGTDRCPECDRVGKHVGYREREITTRRGLDVPLRERECYCPGCRRAFFPSVSGTRPGGGLSLQSLGLSEDRPRGNEASEL
jgi:hypothetical protein